MGTTRGLHHLRNGFHQPRSGLGGWARKTQLAAVVPTPRVDFPVGGDDARVAFSSRQVFDADLGQPLYFDLIGEMSVDFVTQSELSILVSAERPDCVVSTVEQGVKRARCDVPDLVILGEREESGGGSLRNV